MFIPKNYRVEDEERIFSFVRKNAFGQLVSTVAGKPWVTHLPFLVGVGNKTLLAHLAAANPQCRELEGCEVLVTFQGPHDYISPTWYSGPGVPTWNYQAVHVYGKCKVFKDPERLKNAVEALTTEYEKEISKPWRPEYDTKMLKAIVGLEIEITDVQGKFKLSQNKSAKEIKDVANELEQRGAEQLARAMLDELKQL